MEHSEENMASCRCSINICYQEFDEDTNTADRTKKAEAGRIFSVPQGPMCLELSLTKVNARQPRKKEDLYGPSLMSTRTPEL